LFLPTFHIVNYLNFDLTSQRLFSLLKPSPTLPFTIYGAMGRKKSNVVLGTSPVIMKYSVMFPNLTPENIGSTVVRTVIPLECVLSLTYRQSNHLRGFFECRLHNNGKAHHVSGETFKAHWIADDSLRRGDALNLNQQANTTIAAPAMSATPSSGTDEVTDTDGRFESDTSSPDMMDLDIVWDAGGPGAAGAQGISGDMDQGTAREDSEGEAGDIDVDEEEDGDFEMDGGDEEEEEDFEPAIYLSTLERESSDDRSGTGTANDPATSSAAVSLQPPTSLLNPLSASDLVDRWPYPINQCVQALKLSSTTSATDRHPFLFQLIYTAIASVSFTFNVPLRASKFILQTFWIVLSLAAPYVFNSGRRHCPTCSCSGRSEEAATAARPVVPAKRIPAVEGRLGLHADLALHPVCPNKTCNHICYDSSDVILPEGVTNCERCSTALLDDKSKPRYKIYPRNHLVNELERVFAKSGVEELCFSVRERSEITNRRNQKAGTTILQPKRWRRLGRFGFTSE
jgi:hypothetical protein